ncbi:MAG: type II toxin-antitoxin system VapC family toxin [Pyrinomonadaceae bacterium]
MKVYLDTCSLQRPLDSRSQIRITLEAEAILGTLLLHEVGQIELISSEALLFEIERNPTMARKEYALEVLKSAESFVAVNDRVENRATELVATGIGPLDALHLACAEEGRADYFCTSDDGFLKKAKARTDLKTKVVSPVELIEEIET